MHDKRTVSTDALETLGTIVTDAERRDAIHLAVDPREAAEKLFPGQDVGLLPDGRAGAGIGDVAPLGIVDPFLKGPVYPGQWFWLVVYPRQITSLRHVWSHPAFADEAGASTLDKAPSVQWLRNLAGRIGVSYQRLIDAAESYVESGDYLTGGSEMEGEYTPDEFWLHYQIVTGKTVAEDDRGNFFNCSC